MRATLRKLLRRIIVDLQTVRRGSAAISAILVRCHIAVRATLRKFLSRIIVDLQTLRRRSAATHVIFVRCQIAVRATLRKFLSRTIVDQTVPRRSVATGARQFGACERPFFGHMKCNFVLPQLIHGTTWRGKDYFFWNGISSFQLTWTYLELRCDVFEHSPKL